MSLQRPIGLIADAASWLAMAAAALMALHVSAEVVSRLALGHGLTGTIEAVSYFYMVAVTFLPLGKVQMRRDHIVADSLAMIVPRRLRPKVEFLGQLISLAIVGLLLVASISTALGKTRSGEYVLASSFDLPVWPARWFAVVGLGAMFIVFLAQVLRVLPAPPDEDHTLPVD